MSKLKKEKVNMYKIFLVLPVFALLGCQTTKTVEKNNEQTLVTKTNISEEKKSPKPLQQLPENVRNELLKQEVETVKRGMLSEKRLDIAASEVPAEQFFSALIVDSPYSIAIHPDVEGAITLNLKDVTLDEAFELIESIYGYDIQHEGSIVKVFPAGVRTETIPLDYLFISRTGSSSTNVSSGGVSENDPSSGGGSNGSGARNGGSGGSSRGGASGSSNGQNGQNGINGINIFTESESDFWPELKKSLDTLLGNKPGRSVIVSPQAGLVTVRGLPSEINDIKNFLNNIQNSVKRQVIIEAKIMEVTLNDDYQQGIQWSDVVGHIESTDINFSTTGNIANNAIAASIGGVTGLSFRNADFSNVIQLLSTQGNVQVLSSPRITATNNQKAVFKVGEDEYFVTDVSSTTTTGTATTTTPDVDLTPFFSGIALDVTPQVSQSGEVILHVHPSVTITDEQTKVITIGSDTYSLPLAQSSVRESDTIIKAQSGEIVVIGGLIETRKLDQKSKTPLLGDVPVIGELFKNKIQTEQKRELVIMLKPIVIDHKNSWQSQLHGARELLKKWFSEDIYDQVDKVN